MKKNCNPDELIAEATETTMPLHPRCFGHYSDDSPKCDKCGETDPTGFIQDQCVHYTMYLEELEESEAVKECGDTIDALIERKVNDAIESALYGLAGRLKFDSFTGETARDYANRVGLE